MVDASGGARSAAVTRLPHRLARAGLDALADHWRRQPVWDRTVLFESFAGSGFACNPLALYRAMLTDSAFAGFRYTWAVSDEVLARSARPGIPVDERVDFVRYRSRQYFRALARSQYLITNVTFPVSFQKRPEQVYLNTWHGTPLKKMGRDVPGVSPQVLADTQANLRAADLVLSQSPYMTDVMYRGAYGIESGGGTEVLELGYPRVDVQFDAPERIATAGRLAAAGFDVAGRRTVLYAPTWRQASDVHAADDADRIATTIRALQAGPVRVLLRVHDKALAFVARVPELAASLVPASIGTNALLGVTDTLVTDYSSVFFDFLATGSEVLFYAPDRAEYGSARGLYLRDDELPGPLTQDLAELVAWVADGPPRTGHADPAQARDRFCPHDDGAATARVLARVFG